MRIKKGDTILIIKGRDRNKSGKVLRVLPQANKILIEGLNLYKKHQRPKKEGAKGEMVVVPRPISASNAMFLCKNCNRPVKIGVKVEGGVKYRVCKKCGSKI